VSASDYFCNCFAVDRGAIPEYPSSTLTRSHDRQTIAVSRDRPAHLESRQHQPDHQHGHGGTAECGPSDSRQRSISPIPFASWSLDDTANPTVAARNTACTAQATIQRAQQRTVRDREGSLSAVGGLKHHIQVCSWITCNLAANAPLICPVASSSAINKGKSSAAVGAPATTTCSESPGFSHRHWVIGLNSGHRTLRRIPSVAFKVPVHRADEERRVQIEPFAPPNGHLLVI
jgi:hypothetical protein